MLCTFADRIHICHRSLHIIVNYDPAVNSDSAVLRKLDIRLDSHSHYYKLCRQHTAVTEAQTGNPFFAGQFNRLLAHGEFHTLSCKLCL